jgi:hypothetical protein
MMRDVILHDSPNEFAGGRAFLSGKILHSAKDSIGKLDHGLHQLNCLTILSGRIYRIGGAPDA